MTNSRSRSDWGVAEAKAKFSDLIDQAKTDGPQRITKNGREAVVVVSATDWDERAPTPTPPLGRGSLVAFWRATPFHESDLLFPPISGRFEKPVFDEGEP